MSKFFYLIIAGLCWIFTIETVKIITEIAQIEGFLLLIIAAFAYKFTPKAVEKITETAQIGGQAFITTVLRTSFIIVTVFPHQATAGIATSIGLCIIVPKLSALWETRKYAAFTSLSMIAIAGIWYILYATSFTEVVICLILWILAYLIIKNEILVNFLGRLFID